MRGTSTPARGAAGEEPRPRRPYDSAVRRQRAAQTRDRITAEGAALARSLQAWDWKQLTFRAVAERAGVAESTVYRHFASERELHDAVMRHLQEQAGVIYEGMSLDEVSDVAGRVFASLPSFAASAQAQQADDPTMATAAQVRRQALRDAVQAAAPRWSPDQRDAAAGVLDVLWTPPAFELLSLHWHMTPQQATGAIAWVIGLVTRGVHDGTAPESPPSPIPAWPAGHGG
jgi:AcrR family transcriptional regulator